MTGSSQPTLVIDGHRVGAGETPFVIAEVSGNHNGSLDRALEIIDAIARSGAQAVKFQTYTADTITIEPDVLEYKLYARGVGPVLVFGVSGGGGREELIDFHQVDEAVAQAAGTTPLGESYLNG